MSYGIGGVGCTSGAQDVSRMFQNAVKLVASIAQDMLGGGQTPSPAQTVNANQQAAAQQVNPAYGAQGPASAAPAQGSQVMQMLMQLLQMFVQVLQQGQDGGGAAAPSPTPCSPPAQQMAQQLPPPAAAAPVAATPQVLGAAASADGTGTAATPAAAASPSTVASAATGGGSTSSIGPAMVGPAGGRYDNDIEYYAQQYGVDPNIVKAQIAKESQGNPNLESPAGAVGLGQIKPATASELAGRPVSAEELKSNTKLNIELTCKYDAQLLKEKGSYEGMLAAYNQGPNANNPLQTSPEAIDYVHAIMTGAKEGKLPTWGG